MCSLKIDVCRFFFHFKLAMYPIFKEKSNYPDFLHSRTQLFRIIVVILYFNNLIVIRVELKCKWSLRSDICFGRSKTENWNWYRPLNILVRKQRLRTTIAHVPQGTSWSDNARTADHYSGHATPSLAWIWLPCGCVSCGPGCTHWRIVINAWETWTFAAADGVRCARVRWEINFLLTFEIAPFFCVYLVNLFPVPRIEPSIHRWSSQWPTHYTDYGIVFTHICSGYYDTFG
jgi:hypothetical protein